jgi:hypothetical protein
LSKTDLWVLALPRRPYSKVSSEALLSVIQDGEDTTYFALREMHALEHKTAKKAFIDVIPSSLPQLHANEVISSSLQNSVEFVRAKLRSRRR